MRLIAPLLALALAAAAARTPSKKPAQKAGRADGGPVLLGPDKPGRLTPFPAVKPEPDAGTPGTPRDTLEQEVQRLRARVDGLERARDEQAAAAQQLRTELEALRTQVSAAQEQREAAAQEQEDQRALLDEGYRALAYASQRLEAGDADVDAALAQAESSFSGPARVSVQAARAAVRNRDLVSARAHLADAAMLARQKPY